jgi:hypothetical protein
MRTLHLWNRADLKDLAKGVAFDFKIGGETHTFQAEHAYKRVANGNGTAPEAKRGNGHTTFSDKEKRAIVKRLHKERRVDLAKEVGVSATTIGSWRKKYKGDS